MASCQGPAQSNFGSGTLAFIDKARAVVLGDKGFLADVGVDSILARSEYEELRESMIKKDRIQDPANTRVKVRRNDSGSYVTPTIDNESGADVAAPTEDEERTKRSGPGRPATNGIKMTGRRFNVGG